MTVPMEIKEGIRRNFARRAASYDGQARVQRFMAHRLLALIRDLPGRESILEIGCGTGYCTLLLRQAYKTARLVALDLDLALVAAARRRLGAAAGVEWLVADGETPVRGPFDLIIGSAAFQWFTCPAETLAAYFQSLAPEGVLAFSTLGPLTFQELAGALSQASRALQQSTAPAIPAQGFADQETWATLLRQAGFTTLQLVRDTVTPTFPSVWQFLKSLQATGATNPQRPLSPRVLNAAITAYNSRYGGNGSIPATYELIWAVAQK